MRNLLALFGIFVSCNLFALDVKDKIAKTPKTILPFECIRTAPWSNPNYALDLEDLKLPVYIYEDLGLTCKTSYKNDGEIFRRFETNNSYELLALKIGSSDPGLGILVTFTKDGKVIDHIESEVYFCLDKRLYISQYRIDKDMNIIVTHLQINSQTAIPFDKSFSSIQAQRIDTYYRVDSSGKFQQIKQVKFKPEFYTPEYLKDENKNLWEGKEVLENKE